MCDHKLRIRHLEAELAAARREATTDELTGLGNRTALRRLTSTPHAWIALDANGFKRVNDHYGHAEGDRVLVELAARIRECVRAGDSVFRTGGDEFLIGLHRTEDSAALALRLAAIDVSGVTFAVGVGATVGEADAAAYDDKRRRGQQRAA